MKRLLFVVTTIFVTSVCYSQSNFKEGYILTHDKDTVKGFVAFREGVRAFSECVFRRSLKEDRTTYRPLDIAGYGVVGNRVFESRDIALRGQAPTTAFLEVVVKGRVTLYRIGDDFLVQKEGGEFRQLINEKRVETKEITVNESRRYVRQSNEHIIVLNQLLFDCVETREAVASAKLNRRALTKLITRYNECMGASDATLAGSKPGFRARTALVAGYGISGLDFNYRAEQEHLSGTFEPAKSPIMGVSIEFLAPRISERFSFYLAAVYLSPRYKGFTEIRRAGVTDNHFVTIELPQVKIPVGIRYTFPTRSVTPYVNGGLSMSLHMNESSEWTKERNLNGVITTEKGEALDIKSNQLGAWLGAGIQMPIGQKLILFGEVRYEGTDGVADGFFVPDPKFRSTITNIQFLIGLSIK